MLKDLSRNRKLYVCRARKKRKSIFLLLVLLEDHDRSFRAGTVQIPLFQGRSTAQSQLCSSEWESNQYCTCSSVTDAQNGCPQGCPHFGQLLLMSLGLLDKAIPPPALVPCLCNQLGKGAKGQILEV